MALLRFVTVSLAFLTIVAARNSGIHLAFEPTCGILTVPALTVSNVNAGLKPLSDYTTIISFGDSFTSGGVGDGSALPPPVLDPPNPFAGGRATNGRVWIEDISIDTGALFKDYAVGGATTNKTLWPSWTYPSDFIGQVQTFLKQNNTYDPNKTLYTVFFGINDWVASKTDGDKLPQAADAVIEEIKLLARPPTNARDFLVTDDYGRSIHDASGDAYKLKIYNALGALHLNSSLNFAFVDFAPIWDGVLGTTPGYAAFGYKSDGNCTVDFTTTVGACDDPDHTFFWLPGHPSKQTHRIMGDWVESASGNGKGSMQRRADR